MGRVKETGNAFKGNYHGILDHSGKILVAKYDVEQQVTGIVKGDVFVRGVGKKYQCQIHKNLQDSICFLDVGDTAFIKFKKGVAWLVGFQKKPAVDENIVIDGDYTLLQYFQEQKKLSVRGGGLK